VGGLAVQLVCLLLYSYAFTYAHDLMHYQLWLFAAIAHWGATAVIVWRRPKAPTNWDLIFIRSSFVITYPLVAPLVAFAIWEWRGLL
jgi:hypothetical protein